MRPRIGLALLVAAAFAACSAVKLDAPPEAPAVAGDPESSTVFARTGFRKNAEARLIEDLLHTYKSRGGGLARPVADSRERLMVSIKFIVHEYEGIQDVSKRMKLAGILKATWKDVYLSWDPKDYEDLEVIPLRGDDIYLPVIVRQSSAAEMTQVFAREGGLSTLIWVDYQGNVYATVAGVFRTDCQLDLDMFPFDNQTCEYVFQVWQHSEKLLLLEIDKKEPIALKVKTSGTQAMWQIDHMEAGNRIATLDFANFSAVYFTIATSRRSVYYIWNLIVPCALLSTVQLAAFFMPYGPERVMFAITLVLSLHLFQESVARQLPATAEPIPIVKYSGSQMMIGIMVTIESVLMIWLLTVFQGREVPKWLAGFRNMFYTRGRLSGLKLRLLRKQQQEEADAAEAASQANGSFKGSVQPKLSNMALGFGDLTAVEKADRKDEMRDTILMFDRMVFFVCLAATVGIPASVY